MKRRNFTKEKFIEEAKKVHGEKFDYSQVDYKGLSTPVTIICKDCGHVFKQEPRHHLDKAGCAKCYGNCKLTTEEFIERAKDLFPEYDYSLTQYKNSTTKVKIICQEHGVFEITPNNLLNQKQGCRKCGWKKAQMKNRMTQEDFLLKAREVHGWKYDYSKVNYVNTDTKVCIICPEHGEFWQTPHHHLKGIGCPECGRNDLTENKLYEEVKAVFPDAVHTYKPKFLNTTGKPQSLDIFIPSLNTAIEYQGRQHFVSISRYGGDAELAKTKERDERKYLLCKENGVRLLYVSYEKEAPKMYLSTIYNSKDALFEALISDVRH